MDRDYINEIHTAAKQIRAAAETGDVDGLTKAFGRVNSPYFTHHLAASALGIATENNQPAAADYLKTLITKTQKFAYI